MSSIRIWWLTAKRRIKRMLFGMPRIREAGIKVNLNLGCGNINHEKFINIDGYPYPHVHYVQQVERLPQFKDDSVDLIYSSHCLEHFKYSQTKQVLEEWYRVLKKGSILRLSVPDFDKLVHIYELHQRDPDVIIEQLMGGQDNKYNFHLTVLNKVNLSKMLREVGFVDVREWMPGADDITTFDDFSIYKKEVAGNKYEISLNIEAVK